MRWLPGLASVHANSWCEFVFCPLKLSPYPPYAPPDLTWVFIFFTTFILSLDVCSVCPFFPFIYFTFFTLLTFPPAHPSSIYKASWHSQGWLANGCLCKEVNKCIPRQMISSRLAARSKHGPYLNLPLCNKHEGDLCSGVQRKQRLHWGISRKKNEASIDCRSFGCVDSDPTLEPIL